MSGVLGQFNFFETDEVKTVYPQITQMTQICFARHGLTGNQSA